MSNESEHRQNGKLFSKKEINDIVLKLKIDRDIDSIIDILRVECYLILKGSNLYQLQTS